MTIKFNKQLGLVAPGMFILGIWECAWGATVAGDGIGLTTLKVLPTGLLFIMFKTLKRPQSLRLRIFIKAQRCGQIVRVRLTRF